VVRALGTFGAGDAPDDPLFATAQWHLHAVGVPEAWKVSTGVGATVAVLDTGVAYEDLPPFHRAPDLAGTRFVPGYDFVDDDPHPDDVPVPSQHTHGTHIAGTIAQTSGNGIGGAGVAPGAAIMPVRVLAPDGTGTTWATAKGLRFAADHGANVANLSLGGTAGAPELADAVSYAVSKGVTVVVASGDDGRPSLLYPAAYPDVIAVGAVRLDGTRPRYSNYGPGLALVAPGGDLQSDQNGDRLDDGIVQQTVFDEPGSFCFCFLEGTSSAAAHVSGAAALVVASGRATRPADVRAALVSTAHDLGPPGRDDDYGAGLLQIPPALGLRFDYRPPVTVTSPAAAPVPGGTDPGAGSASVTVRGGALPASPRNPPGSPADGATALALAVGVGVAAVVVGVWAISRHGQHRRGP
jgi:serine protease